MQASAAVSVASAVPLEAASQAEEQPEAERPEVAVVEVVEQ